MDSSAVEYIDKNGNSQSLKAVLENSIDKLTKEGIEGLLGLTKEEIEAMTDLILDTEVRIDKTYSSSKIYSDIQDAIDSSKSFTLNEIGKMSGASYKVVASTTEMTDEKIIYLLENGTTYDMYIVETTGTVTKIGDTTIDLSSYLKVTDAESAYLKKTEATSTYVAQTSFNNHITDTVAHLTQLEKNKLLTTDNITSTINNSSDNTQVPSAKATYDLANTKANTNHTHNTSDITDLSIPTKVGDLENDRGYLTKTDANKLDCVTIDNVSLKEYILTNFTETEKTYYLIATQTCTDLPKASNFYITVETPGLYTYKVTAKELRDGNSIYVCTYRTISSTWTEWEKVLSSSYITDTISTSSTDEEVPSAKAINAKLGEKADKTELNSSKKLYITNTSANIKFVKITSAPTNGSSIYIHFKSVRTNTTFEEETVRISKYISKTVYDGKIIQKSRYAANGNTPIESEANFLVTLDDYSVWAHIASYSTADIELYSYDRKQSIDGTEATTLPSEVKYSMFDGVELATMDKLNYSTDKLNYSTTETPIGTWIDGKTIYRICVNFPSCQLKPNEWNIVNSLSITGIDEIINARAKRSEDNSIIPLAVRSRGTSIEVNPSMNFSVGKLILEYTKNN